MRYAANTKRGRLLRRSVLLAVQCLLVGLLGLVANVGAQPSAGLFVAEAPPLAPAAPDRAARDAASVLRNRFARIDDDILTAARLRVDDPAARPAVVRLNLFDDVVLDAAVHDTGPTSAGYWLSGHIEGSPPGTLVLVVNGDIVAGTVLAPAGTYSIRSMGDGVLAIRQIDSSSLRRVFEPALSRLQASPPGGGPDRVQPITWPPPSSQAAAAGDEEDGSRIDVLVLYDPHARTYFGGHAGIRAEIDLAVAGTNEAFATSGVIQRIHVVSAQEVDDLHGEATRRLRDQLAADIVFQVDGDPELCGPGHLGGCGAASVTLYESLQGEVRTYEHRAYAFLSPDHLNPVNFAHELGHVMGLWHDRYTVQKYGDFLATDNCSDGVPCAVSYQPYSYGYVNQRAFDAEAPASSPWITIMSYYEQCNDSGLQCSQTLRFSNPDQTYNGDPLGVPGDERSSDVTGPADARRSLNDARRIIANYRVSPCLRGGSGIRLQARNGQFLTAERGGGGTITADRDEAGAWERFELEVRDGGCAESGDAVSLRTSDGFYLTAELGGGSGLDATGASAGAWETFTVHRQAGDGAIRSGDSIALEASDGHYVVAVLGGGGPLNAGGTRLIEAWETFRVSANP